MKYPAIVLTFILFFFFSVFGQETNQPVGNTPIDVFRRHQVERLNDEIKEKPQDANLYLDRAYYLKELKDIPAFLKDVSMILSLKPEITNYFYRNLASVVISKQPDETEKYLKYLSSANPKHCFPYYLSSSDKLSRKDYKGAIDDGIKAVERSSSGTCDSQPIFDSLYNLKSDKDVFKYYERVFNSFEKRLNQLRAKNARLSRSKSKEYISAVKNADGLALSIHSLCFRWAFAYNKLGETEKENRILEKMVQIKPLYNAYQSRVGYFRQTKQLQRMNEDSVKLNAFKIEKLTQDIDLEENLLRKAYFYIQRGDTFLELKQYDQAIADYNMAKTLYPQYEAICDWRITLVNNVRGRTDNPSKQLDSKKSKFVPADAAIPPTEEDQ